MRGRATADAPGRPPIHAVPSVGCKTPDRMPIVVVLPLPLPPGEPPGPGDGDSSTNTHGADRVDES